LHESPQKRNAEGRARGRARTRSAHVSIRALPGCAIMRRSTGRRSRWAGGPAPAVLPGEFSGHVPVRTWQAVKPLHVPNLAPQTLGNELRRLGAPLAPVFAALPQRVWRASTRNTGRPEAGALGRRRTGRFQANVSALSRSPRGSSVRTGHLCYGGLCPGAGCTLEGERWADAQAGTRAPVMRIADCGSIGERKTLCRTGFRPSSGPSALAEDGLVLFSNSSVKLRRPRRGRAHGVWK